MKKEWVDFWRAFAKEKNPYCPGKVDIEGDMPITITTTASYADIVGCPPSGKPDELYLTIEIQLKEESGKFVVIYKRFTKQGFSQMSSREWQEVTAAFADRFNFTVLETTSKGVFGAVFGTNPY